MASMTDQIPAPFVAVWGVRGGRTLLGGGVSMDDNDMPYWANLIRPDFFIGPRPAPEGRSANEYCASAAAVGAKAVLYAPEGQPGQANFPGFGGWMNTDEPEFKETPKAYLERWFSFKDRGLVWGSFTHNIIHPTATLDSSEYAGYLRGCHIWGFNRYPEQYNIPLDQWENLATRVVRAMTAYKGEAIEPLTAPWYYVAATALHIKGGYVPTPESFAFQMRWAKRMGARGLVIFPLIPPAWNAAAPFSWNGTSKALLDALPGLIAEFRAPGGDPQSEIDRLEKELALCKASGAAFSELAIKREEAILTAVPHLSDAMAALEQAP